jgi:hypothetical protein
MSSGCESRVRAQFKSDAPQGRAFLEQGVDGVNEFLVQAGVTMGNHPLRQHGPHVTIRRESPARFGQALPRMVREEATGRGGPPRPPRLLLAQVS